jgi:hypothetical protein
MCRYFCWWFFCIIRLFYKEFATLFEALCGFFVVDLCRFVSRLLGRLEFVVLRLLGGRGGEQGGAEGN